MRLFALRLAGTFLIATLVIPAVAVRVEAQSNVVEHVGQLQAINHGEFLDGSLILAPERRRGYQIEAVGDDFTSVLHEFDLDTMAPTRIIELPQILDSAPASRQDPHVAVDERNGRLFFAYLKGAGDPGLAGILVVDQETGTVVDQPVSVALERVGFKVGGISYSPQDDRLYILLRNNPRPDPEFVLNQTALSGQTPRVFLMSWNPTTGEEQFIRYIRACRNLFPSENPSGHYQLPVMRSTFEAAVWVPCSNAQGGFQIIRLPFDQLADPAGTEDVFSGPERVRDVLADPGSDRMYARYSAALGESWWVFDGRQRSWVGVIGASKQKDRSDYAAGVDPSSGRLYLHYPGVGLLLADARRTPVPQALVFPDIEKGDHPSRIWVDTKTRQFFMRTAERDPASSFPEDVAAVQNIRDNRYDIFRDAEPAPPPPPPDPDENTTDVPEQEGVTDVSFTGIGQGYGVRTLLIGGAWGIVPPGPGAEDSRPIRAILNRSGSQCGPRDREIAIGVVEKTELGNSVATARAQAAMSDESTSQDFQSPSRCDIHPDYGIPGTEGAYPGIPPSLAAEMDKQAQEGLDWANLYATGECSGDEETSDEASREPFEGMQASVMCQQSKTKAEAEAGGPAIETEFLKVGTAFSRTKLFREARRGIVSQVYSVARGISLADGLVEIDGVEAWAEASANGREKNNSRDDTATTRFVRRVTGITVKDASGRTVFTCEHCSQDILTAQQQINAAIAGRGEIRLPMPDPVLLAGTPGGYQAAVQKDRFQQIADNSLNNDPSREVPGLEIISINDSPELRARQVIQLAGVAAGASYGIFLLENFDFSSLPSFPDAEVLPSGSQLISTPTSGTVVSEALTSAPPALDPPSLNDRARDFFEAIPTTASYLIQNPVEGLLAAAVWLLLGLPLYAFLRRRSLVKSLDTGVEQ